MEYYSAMRKEEILLFVTAWINLEVLMLSKRSCTQKDKYCRYHLACGILKSQTHRSKGGGQGLGGGEEGEMRDFQC